MKRVSLQDMTVDQLVERFVSICVAEDQALLQDEHETFNRLFSLMEAVKEELKARPGDQRRALLSLYSHPNAQVRVKAAKATLAVAPLEARLALEKLAASKEYPQAGEAGMSLVNLDRGIFKPS
jgi:hypothetical protein